jgi:1-acyl-sn-glycerol-3-phosphate acyltransferase
MNRHGDTPAGTAPILDIDTLLDTIRNLVGEVHPKWKNLRFTPDTHLERDLGLDSLARMELRTRIEHDLGICLDERVAIDATTPKALLQALLLKSHKTLATPEGQVDAGTADELSSDLLMGPFGAAGNADYTPGTHGLTDWLYALYTWPVFLVIGALSWFLVVVTPSARWRHKLAHYCARLFFFCTFTPLRVTGAEYLYNDRPQILVANHASYLDGFIVTAALNVPFHFIVKGELARIFHIRVMLERFGVEFVDRFNANKGASSVRRIAEKAKNGQSIVFFPEGTFTTFPGLQPFRMGAFVTAAMAGVPVVPVAISGSRQIVRGTNWFPHHGRLEVTVRPAILPTATDWQAALELRDHARREISRYCGEPDLVEGGAGSAGKSGHD